MKRTATAHRVAPLEALEGRICLASVGWDGPGRGGAALTYYIGNAPSSLSQSAVVTALRAALYQWAKVADVTFTRTSLPNQPDSIDFTFRSIDGRGGTLAQAYFPDDVNTSRRAGDVQFDSSERWEVGNGLGTAAFDLVLTAVHEIGHSLGLDHSRVPGSVMGATISASQRFTGLAATDVSAIRQLYASASSATASARQSAASPPAQTATVVAAPGEVAAVTTVLKTDPHPTFRWASWPGSAGADEDGPSELATDHVIGSITRAACSAPY